MDALVADAHHPNAVAGLRALGRAGITAIALGRGRSSAGRWSRWATAREKGGLAEAALRRGSVVVYPGWEDTIDELLSLRPRLPGGVVLPYPGADPVRAVRDKARLSALAGSHGLGAPATLFEGPAAALAGAAIPLPAIVKPALPAGGLPTARLVRSPTELDALVAGLPVDERLLAQEYVHGRLVSLALVLDRDGRVAARFQEEAIRTWPREAGTFAATVSVEPDDELVDRARSTLAAVGYWGLAQLDLVRRGDDALLLDVNPRYYLCMPLALACGVNLPAAWHAVVEGRPGASPTAYPVGRRYRWLEGDVYAARHGHPLALLRPRRPAHAGAMWARDDPLPSLLLAGCAATRPVRRRVRAMRSGR